MTVDAEEERRKKEEEGCSRTALHAFAVLVFLVFGWPLTCTTGKPQLDELEAMAIVEGPDLARLEDGTAVRLSGTLMEDHPVIRAEQGYIAVRHYTKRIRGESSGDYRYIERDLEESEMPALRFHVDGVPITLDADYFIIHTDTMTLDERSTDYLQIRQFGLHNGEHVGVAGHIVSGGAAQGLTIRDGRIISGNAASLTQHYTDKLYPFYYIGLALSGTAVLLLIPLLLKMIFGIIAIVRFFNTPPTGNDTEAP